jgi:hypothetical protein
MATLEMAMVPIGIESLMISLLMLITGKYKPVAPRRRRQSYGRSVPVSVGQRNARQVQTGVPSTEIFKDFGRCMGTLPGALVLHPVQEYSVHPSRYWIL